MKTKKLTELSIKGSSDNGLFVYNCVDEFIVKKWIFWCAGKSLKTFNIPTKERVNILKQVHQVLFDPASIITPADVINHIRTKIPRKYGQEYLDGVHRSFKYYKNGQKYYWDLHYILISFVQAHVKKSINKYVLPMREVYYANLQSRFEKYDHIVIEQVKNKKETLKVIKNTLNGKTRIIKKSYQQKDYDQAFLSQEERDIKDILE